jgi:signal transduction histidine kinase
VRSISGISQLLARLGGLGIRDKILVAYVLLTFPVLVVLGLTWLGANRITATADAVRNDVVPALASLEALRTFGTHVIEATNAYALINAVERKQGQTENPFSVDKKSELLTAIEDFTQALRAYQAEDTAQEGNAERFRRNIEFSYQDIVKYGERVMKLVADRASPSQLLQVRERFDTKAQNFRALVQGAIEAQKAELNRRQAELNQDIELWFAIAVAVGGLVIVVTVISGMHLANRIARPIRQLRDAAARVGEGEFDAPNLRTTRDEVGELADSFAGMVVRLRDLMRQQRERTEIAEEANRAKSAFLATISHELRTPLNAIIGFSEILRNQMFGPVGSPRYREYIGDINASAVHLLSLVNDLLDLAKAEAGKHELHEEALDLEDIARTCLRIIAERAADTGVRLEHSSSFDGRLFRGDERKLRQIMLNLLSNAVKFTPQGGVVSLDVSCGHDEAVEIVVRDTGIGMAPRDISKALEPFGQVADVMTRGTGGTGLGLPLTAKLVELHGGSLAIESVPGSGTAVRIRFPFERTLRAAAEQQSAASSQELPLAS